MLRVPVAAKWICSNSRAHPRNTCQLLLRPFYASSPNKSGQVSETGPAFRYKTDQTTAIQGEGYKLDPGRVAEANRHRHDQGRITEGNKHRFGQGRITDRDI
jgi:hypothetical protein